MPSLKDPNATAGCATEGCLLNTLHLGIWYNTHMVFYICLSGFLVFFFLTAVKSILVFEPESRYAASAGLDAMLLLTCFFSVRPLGLCHRALL